MADMNVPSDPAPFAPTLPPARRPLFWPVVLIGIGVIALLFNVGWLDWARVSQVLQLWPLLLIALGLAIVFRDRLPVRLASIVGAVILLLFVAAVAGGLASIPGALSASSGPVVTTSFSAPVGEVTKPRLDLSAGASRITVRAGSTAGDLYRATVSSPSDAKPDVHLEASSETLFVSLPNRSGFHFGDSSDHRSIDLTLDDQLPWVVALSSGASTTNLDLTGLKLTSVELSTGASDVRLQLPKPSGTVPVSVSGGAMHLVVKRPAGTPIHVVASGGASSLTIDGHEYGGLFHEGDLFTSTDYPTASDRYSVTIESGASSTTIS
jgi:hypothetical protein